MKNKIMIILFIVILLIIGIFMVSARNKITKNETNNSEVNDLKVETNEDNENNLEDVTQKIINKQTLHSGIINNVDDKYIYYLDNDSEKFEFEKNSFSFINGRTSQNMNLSDINIGDFIEPYDNQILVFRNISGEELNQELINNFTLTAEKRFMYVNSVEIEEINITDANTAIVKINYGDIIGEQLTNEKFTMLVEFNNSTKYSSKGDNIHNVNELENAKGNINSIILKKDSINKKNPAIVSAFECDDT